MSLVKLPQYVPAVDLMRGDIVDMRFFAVAALYKKDKKVFSIGEDNNYPFFLRSLLKPAQSSIMADYDTKEFFDFNDKQIAVMQGSHAGEKIHTDLVKSILSAAGLDETYLKCPPIPPLNPDVLKPLQNPSNIHNNCSGKHSMMLAVSKQLGFPLDTYAEPEHPVQKIILNKIIELSGFNNPPVSFDGCTVPVWALPFENIKNLFFTLYNDKKYKFLKTAYKNNPYIIGGVDSAGLRQDTFFMKLNPDLISKTGAGGFLSVYNDSTDEFLLIKMAQDNNHARLLFAASLLEKLNWIKENPVDYNFYDENKRAVGRYKVLI